MNTSGMIWIEPVSIPKGTSELEIHDVEIRHIGGYSYDCVAKTNRGDMPVQVPTWKDKPENMDPKVWACSLTKQQVMAAAKVYTDIWTWHDDSEHYRMLMDLFVLYHEGKFQGGKPVIEGSLRYNTATAEIQLMTGGNWIQVAG